MRAPATSANLGPGFDCLGLALDLWNDVEAVPGAARPDTQNLILRAAQRVFDEVGAPNPGFSLACDNRIPFGRGLGSSAAAISCGVLIANHCLGQPLSEGDCVRVATLVEGHPDNVAPCLLGGIRVATVTDAGDVVQCAVPSPLSLRGVVFIPDQRVPTSHARDVLPVQVQRADALFNVARASLLVAALAAGRRDLLAEATRDRLHQPFRQSLFPAGAALLQCALDAGALGAFTSGAGPTVLALCDSASTAAAVQDAFRATARMRAAPGQTLCLDLITRGAYVAH